MLNLLDFGFVGIRLIVLLSFAILGGKSQGYA